MADRMGMDTLVHNLERLCREHKAMQILLSEHDDKWRSDVLQAVRKNAIQNAVHTQFREVNESLQFGHTAMTVVDLLAQVVDKSSVSWEA